MNKSFFEDETCSMLANFGSYISLDQLKHSPVEPVHIKRAQVKRSSYSDAINSLDKSFIERPRTSKRVRSRTPSPDWYKRYECPSDCTSTPPAKAANLSAISPTFDTSSNMHTPAQRLSPSMVSNATVFVDSSSDDESDCLPHLDFESITSYQTTTLVGSSSDESDLPILDFEPIKSKQPKTKEASTQTSNDKYTNPADAHWAVDAVLNESIVNGNRYYLIKWHNSWERADYCFCPDKIKDYKRSKALQYDADDEE